MTYKNDIRNIDRCILSVLGGVIFLAGLYLVGPWYIETIDRQLSSTLSLFGSRNAVNIYGGLELAVGLILMIAVWFKRITRGWITTIIFLAFVVRLYSTIGVVIALNGEYLPPRYLSQVGLLVVLGIYWLYLKKREFK